MDLVCHRQAVRSHPARGARIEITYARAARYIGAGSHPARGARIEIEEYKRSIVADYRSHPARGARIEMPGLLRVQRLRLRRTPPGVRGLKCDYADRGAVLGDVALRQGCED